MQPIKDVEKQMALSIAEKLVFTMCISIIWLLIFLINYCRFYFKLESIRYVNQLHVILPHSLASMVYYDAHFTLCVCTCDLLFIRMFSMECIQFSLLGISLNSIINVIFQLENCILSYLNFFRKKS